MAIVALSKSKPPGVRSRKRMSGGSGFRSRFYSGLAGLNIDSYSKVLRSIHLENAVTHYSGSEADGVSLRGVAPPRFQVSASFCDHLIGVRANTWRVGFSSSPFE